MALTMQVPFEYLPVTLAIIGHSFAESSSEHTAFLGALKEGFLAMVDEMNATGFKNLLEAISDLT